MPEPLTFQGTWSGKFIIRDCSTVGWPDCYPQRRNEIYPSFDLTLTQTSDRVEGTLRISPNTLSVTGIASGNVLTLQGSVAQPVSGANVAVRITEWSTTRDAAGRMKGSFRYVNEVTWTVPDRGVWSTKYEAELVSMVLSR